MTRSPEGFSAPRVVFFDIGQTLVEGGDPPSRRVLSNRLNLSEKEARRVGKIMMTHPCPDPADLSRVVGQELPRRSLREVRRAVEFAWAEARDSVRVIPGAGALLELLKSRGVELGVISTTWHPSYEGFRRSFAPWLSLLDHAILSYRQGIKKPALELYRRAVAGTGQPPQACWMVGDSWELDMEPAAKTGMHTLWILRHPEREKAALASMLRGERRVPRWVAEDLEEAAGFFRKIMEE